MSKKLEWWQETGALNRYSYLQYYNRLTELSVSMFEYLNLPDTIDARFLELILFRNGYSVFFKDEVLDYLALPCAMAGQWDVYNIPKQRRAYATNGYQKELDENNSVIIYNNFLRTPSSLDVLMFSRRLENLDRAIDVNANAQKTPILIRCDENQRLSMENVYKQYDGNKPIIYGTKELNKDALEVMKTDAPYVADKLYELKTQIWNEALTYLGISNTNVTKKERMITDEVTRNMGGVIASRYGRLEARRQALDKINKMFSLNIEVRYRDDFQEIEDNYMLPNDTDIDSASPKSLLSKEVNSNG